MGGLPQGTKMGPLGFQVIINDAASEADTNVWKYVDDLTLASNVSNLAKSTLQEDLDNFVDWSKNNSLTLNPLKCQGLQMCFMQNCAKILGIWLQDDLKWDKQIKEMLQKANSRLYMLRNLKRFVLIPLSSVLFTKALLDPY